VEVLGVPLIVVLGHDECGAVLAAIDSVGADAVPLPTHVSTLIQQIVPAVRRVASHGVDPAGSVSDTGTIDPSTVDSHEVGKEHLRDTIASLLDESELISERVARGTLAIVGANYRLLEGVAIPDVHLGPVTLDGER